MVPFLVDEIEEIAREFCMNGDGKNAKKTVDLLKLNVMDRDVQKPDVDLGFGMKHEITILKSINKITDTQIQNFREQRNHCPR